MSESSQNYKDLAIPFFREVFELIDDVLKSRGIPYYLIGATAIGIEILKKGIKPWKATKDIDFAIMLSSLEVYDEVIEDLQKVGFEKQEDPWRFSHKEYEITVDLLPYGEIEENNTVNFVERKTELHVLGYKEILPNSQQYEIEGRTFQAPPLPGMVILKLVAWSDRPEKRGNDLYDVIKIIDHYNEIEFEANMKEHYDLIPEEDEFDERKFSARILGRQAKTYLDESEDLEARIFEVLEANTVDAEESRIAKYWATEKGWDLEYCVALLEEFKAGLTEGIS